MALSDTQSFVGINASTASFQLWGGQYSIGFLPGAGSTATWVFERLGPDGVTYVHEVTWSATSFVNGTRSDYQIPPGVCQIALAAGTPNSDSFEIVRF